MKYSKVGFREIYHKFCLFQMTDTIRNAMQFFPGADEANAVLITFGTNTILMICWSSSVKMVRRRARESGFVLKDLLRCSSSGNS